MDTLSWARLGATVTGVDFSGPAILAARRLARRAKLKAKFVESNVYDLPRALAGQFDVVYTAKGVLTWLPDLDRWGEVVATFLKPGGKFFLLEDHPVAEVFSNETPEFAPTVPYFTSGAMREEYDGTYATSVKMKNRVSYFWLHKIQDVLSALVDHGLHIEQVREYPYSYWRRYPYMRQDRAGYWHLNQHDGLVPLMWSVTARKPTSGIRSV